LKTLSLSDKRRTSQCHALIIVCLLTSATSILVLEGLSTGCVIEALERHAARYGMPAQVFVDSGTQLTRLEESSFNLRNINSHLSSSQRFTITVATPRAHHQQGRAEAKIKVLRNMLTAWSNSAEEANTLIGWETIFARISSAVDDLPIARGSASAASDIGWEIITANRLKLGRNNYRQLDGPIRLEGNPSKQLERNRILTSKWYELFLERLSLLIPPPSKSSERVPKIGDIVVFVYQDPNLRKLWTWKVGLIVEQLSRSTFRIKYNLAPKCETRTVDRSAAQICVVLPVDELDFSHPQFFDN